MHDQWKRPHLPQCGDADLDLIHVGVGRVVCAWEEIETVFSHLYSCFVGMKFEVEAMYEYEERRKIVDKAELYFMDQDKESELEILLAERDGAKARRNDVGHSIVRSAWFFIQTAAENEVLLVPPVYKSRNAPKNNIPIYAYNHASLTELASNLLKLAHRITQYTNEKFPTRGRAESYDSNQ
jgi:hypothetical protein